MFGHVQVYSAYSFQESTLDLERLCYFAKQRNINMLALTDKNNMYGAMKFTKLCQKYGIKPIYGLEASLTVNGEIYPFTLLAKDTQGYYALVKITTLIQKSENNAIPIEMIFSYANHIYLLMGGRESFIYSLISKDMDSLVVDFIKKIKEVFANHFYVMIINHGIKAEENNNKKIVSFCTVHNLSYVCSNAVCYLDEKEAMTVAYLNAIKKHMPVELITNQAYLKDEQEMLQIFSEEEIKRTNRLLLSCNATIPLHEFHLPKYPTPNNAPAAQFLSALCKAGLKKRFNHKSIPLNYIERLKYELDVIIKMNFTDYFLIVYDYVRYAKSQGILVGPGRGSACGSLVAYVLGITNIDPIAYDLLFERFLNPERVSMPDIDIDFQDDRREEVVNYVVSKYGENHVCQIVAFNTYGPKVAIKDIGKIANLSPNKINLLSNQISSNPKLKKSCYETYQSSAEFQIMVNRDPLIQKIMPSIFIVENLPRNISKHAAGVVLSNECLEDIIPLSVGPSKTVVCQYDKDYIEDLGLFKMDFLGLKNLTIIQYILNDIEKSTGTKIDLNNIPLNDQKTYELLANGDTFGVFQMESDGMISLLRKMKVSQFEDIVAANALFRPGPMENIEIYLKRKNKLEPIKYYHPDLKPILEPTYGVMIYQEQIMRVASTIAGFSLAKADLLRKAVSKKEASSMNQMREDFISGAINKGYEENLAVELFNHIEKFAGYGFNRSHSVAYAKIAYQMAYLKVHYPLYFFAAILSHEQSSDHSKLICMQEARKYGVSLLKPSINRSKQRFIVEQGNIRYALTAIKNVGQSAYLMIDREMTENGTYKDLFDFFRRMERVNISNLAIESLIDAGALDEFGYSRKTLKNNIKLLRENAEYENKYFNMNILNEQDQFILQNVEDDSKWELLENEKRVLGIYLTTHPVVMKRQQLQIPCVQVGFLMKAIGKYVNVVLCIERVKKTRDKNGQNMAFLTCYDETGTIDCTLFYRQYEANEQYLKRGNIVLINGKVEFRNVLSLTISKISNIK